MDFGAPELSQYSNVSTTHSIRGSGVTAPKTSFSVASGIAGTEYQSRTITLRAPRSPGVVLEVGLPTLLLAQAAVSNLAGELGTDQPIAPRKSIHTSVFQLTPT